MMTSDFYINRVHLNANGFIGRVEWAVIFSEDGAESIGSGNAVFPSDHPVTTLTPVQVSEEQLVEWLIELHGGAAFIDNLSAVHGQHLAQVKQELPLQPYVGALPYRTPPPSLRVGVSPRQIRQALTQVGLRTQVESAVSAGSQELKDWWEFSTSIERMHPTVVAMGQGLGVSDSDMDALFDLARNL